ncbi:hypothetical protein FRC08_011754 [Ceratobasidium sp. 394]|nr:hypothetical protein FRC08_011754 [Ceratobasidium sp. 394]
MFPNRLSLDWQFNLESVQHSDAVLRSITVLHLQEMVIPWPSTAYHGLVDLRLEFSAESETWISAVQLSGILAASLTLEVLKLSGLGIVRPRNWDLTTSIPLVHLRVLHLGGMYDASWELLLPLVSISDCLGSLSIGFHMHSQDNLTDLIDDFLRNTPTETLVFSEASVSGASPLWALSVSRTIPALKNLVLSQFNILDIEDLEAMEAELGSNDPSSRQTHALNHLYLVSSDINLDDLKIIVPMYNVRTLHLESCTVVETEEANPPITIAELRERLLKAFPHLVCVISNVDTTSGWPCRTMLDQFS